MKKFSNRQPLPPGAGLEILCVLLGASNLSRGYYGLAEHLRRGLAPANVKVVGALGPGRGYSVASGFANVVYPPLKDSKIFEAAKRLAEESDRVAALISDIGNDVMNGVPCEQIMADLTGTMEKLRALGARLVVAPIPKNLERRLTPAAFNILRSLFYPRSGMTLETTILTIRRVNEFLEGLEGGVRLVRGLEPYCGWDMIHYGPFDMRRAWSLVAEEIFAALEAPSPGGVRSGLMRESLQSHLARIIFCDMIPLRKHAPDLF